MCQALSKVVNIQGTMKNKIEPGPTLTKKEEEWREDKEGKGVQKQVDGQLLDFGENTVEYKNIVL